MVLQIEHIYRMQPVFAHKPLSLYQCYHKPSSCRALYPLSPILRREHLKITLISKNLNNLKKSLN